MFMSAFTVVILYKRIIHDYIALRLSVQTKQYWGINMYKFCLVAGQSVISRIPDNDDGG